jgi:lysozyme family protein
VKSDTQLINEVIAREGDYVNHAADRGGPTRYGITQAVARADGYTGDMRVFPIERARAIYRRQYWTGPRFDLVAAIAPRVAAELFDTGVNMGPKAAIKFLQRSLNNLQGSGLDVDGGISADGATLKALKAYMAARGQQDGELVLVEAQNNLQGVRYQEIVEADPSQRAFVFGQIRYRVMDRSASA